MHPEAEQEVKFVRKVLLGGYSFRVEVVNVSVLACVLRTTTNKREVVNFLRKKVHRRENPGYAYV